MTETLQPNIPSFLNLSSEHKCAILSILKMHSPQSIYTCTKEVCEYLNTNNLGKQQERRTLAAKIVEENKAILTDTKQARIVAVLAYVITGGGTGFFAYDTPLAHKVVESITGVDPQLPQLPQLKFTHIEGFHVVSPLNITPFMAAVIAKEIAQRYFTAKRLQNQLNQMNDKNTN